MQVLEPIDDIKVQVQINTITMAQIKDMLMKQSAEALERDENIIKLQGVIEDLRNAVISNKTTAEPSLDHQHLTTEASSFLIPIRERRNSCR